MSSYIRHNILDSRTKSKVRVMPIITNSNIYTDDDIRVCLEKIDAICYINLAYRIDRNEHILNEIHKFCKDDSKIHRIEAIKMENGALGCGLSHIKTLEYALNHPEWNTILLLEDDFTFKSTDSNEICYHLRLLLETDPDFNMGLLSHNNLHYSDTNVQKIKKIQFSQTTSAYIIKKDYLLTLINNFKEAMADMQQFGKKHENCIDIYWEKLQNKHNWYALYPAIGYQYDNYSDIENRHCAYGC
jgi:GR25 family glycosyltransferase involved in LPS biosynthesis